MARILLYIEAKHKKQPWLQNPGGIGMSAQTTDKKGIRWDVFIPCFLIIGGAAILGVVNNAWLTKVTQAVFG